MFFDAVYIVTTPLVKYFTNIKSMHPYKDYLVSCDDPDKLNNELKIIGAMLLHEERNDEFNQQHGYYINKDGHYIMRCLRNPGYVKFHVEQMGYCKVIDESPLYKYSLSTESPTTGQPYYFIYRTDRYSKDLYRAELFDGDRLVDKILINAAGTAALSHHQVINTFEAKLTLKQIE